MSDVMVRPSRFVTLELAEKITGYSAKAMARKIERGDWAEGSEYVRAPDSRLLIDLPGFERWASRRTEEASRSASRSRGRSADPH